MVMKLKLFCLGSVFGLGSFFGMMGCIDSPLLNHAKGNASNIKIEASADPLCPLFFSTQGLCANITWKTAPTDDQAGEFIIRFWIKAQGSENGPYVDPVHDVAVKLWMPSMGHGSSPVKVSKTVDMLGNPVIGSYDAKEVFFVMGGKWEIWIHLKQDGKTVDQSKQDIEI